MLECSLMNRQKEDLQYIPPITKMIFATSQLAPEKYKLDNLNDVVYNGLHDWRKRC